MFHSFVETSGEIKGEANSHAFLQFLKTLMILTETLPEATVAVITNTTAHLIDR